MSKQIGVGVLVILGLCLGGILVSFILQLRENAGRLRCKRNLHDLALAVEHFQSTYEHFPTATNGDHSIPPEKRLSWLADMLPFLGIGGGEGATKPDLDRQKAWDDPSNFPLIERDRKGPIGKMAGYYEFYCCSADPACDEKIKTFQTTYVGLTGLGEDAGLLHLNDPRVGFFGHDRKIRSRDITDGLSSSAIIVETGQENGYWFAGGDPTARGLILDQIPYLGESGQFTSHHRYRPSILSVSPTAGCHFAFADGSVRFVTEEVSPQILQAIFTIRGGELISAVGED